MWKANGVVARHIEELSVRREEGEPRRLQVLWGDPWGVLTFGHVSEPGIGVHFNFLGTGFRGIEYVLQ